MQAGNSDLARRFLNGCVRVPTSCSTVPNSLQVREAYVVHPPADLRAIRQSNDLRFLDARVAAVRGMSFINSKELTKGFNVRVLVWERIHVLCHAGGL